jgi:hypothetical protein
MNLGETTLKLRCTVCGRALRSFAVSNVATEVRSQKCRGCRAPHTIKTVPREIPGGMAHIVTFTATRSP